MSDRPRTQDPGAASATGTLLELAQAQLLRLAILMIFLNLAIPLGLYFYALFIDRSYWRMFQGGDHLVDWFSSIQLLLVAWIAWMNRFASGLLQRQQASAGIAPRWAWGAVALGFLLFSVDEIFDIHEGLRDGLFRPLDIFVGISWLIDGDVGLYLFFVVGVMVSYFLLSDLDAFPRARILFWLALLLTLPVIVIDSLEDDVLQQWSNWRFWDYTFEEVGEIWAQLLFLCAFMLVLAGRLGQLRELERKGAEIPPA